MVLFGTKASLQRDVVTRYPISLEQQHYASTTINLRLAAVRRLAYEAVDCGLLSADLAAGIRRVKGAKRLGMPVGNWLSAEQGKRLLRTVDLSTLRGKRDYATLALLSGCGLRCAELTALRVEDIQQREEPASSPILLARVATYRPKQNAIYDSGSRHPRINTSFDPVWNRYGAYQQGWPSLGLRLRPEGHLGRG